MVSTICTIIRAQQSRAEHNTVLISALLDLQIRVCTVTLCVRADGELGCGAYARAQPLRWYAHGLRTSTLNSYCTSLFTCLHGLVSCAVVYITSTVHHCSLFIVQCTSTVLRTLHANGEFISFSPLIIRVIAHLISSRCFLCFCCYCFSFCWLLSLFCCFSSLLFSSLLSCSVLFSFIARASETVSPHEYMYSTVHALFNTYCALRSL